MTMKKKKKKKKKPFAERPLSAIALGQQAMPQSSKPNGFLDTIVMSVCLPVNVLFIDLSVTFLYDNNTTSLINSI